MLFVQIYYGETYVSTSKCAVTGTEARMHTAVPPSTVYLPFIAPNPLCLPNTSFPSPPLAPGCHPYTSHHFIWPRKAMKRGGMAASVLG